MPMRVRTSLSASALALIVSLSFLSVRIDAQNIARTLPIDSDVYRLMRALYLAQGLAEPEASFPWTVAEARTMLGRIDVSRLSSAGKAALDEILDALNPPPLYADRWLRFAANPSLSPEFFLHSELGQDGGRPETAYAWEHGYEERMSLLSLPLEAWYGENLAAAVDVSVKEEHNTVSSGPMADRTTFPAGVIGNHSNLVFDDPNPRIDLYFPFRAFFSMAGAGWSVRMGRDRLSWGNGATGNLMLSSYSDFYDFMGYSLWSERFKATAVYIGMDRFPLGGAPSETRDSGTYAFLGHRFDFRPLRWLLVTLSESVVFGGTLPPDYLRDLNTLMIFHNWTDPERMNSLMTLELSATPWPCVRLYAQGAMDELRTSYEASGDGGGGPGVFGFLGGAEAILPMGTGWATIGLEGAWTSPWLYNRRKEPYYYNVRRYWSLTTDKFEFIAKPIGYEFGPDVALADFSLDWSVPGSWSAFMGCRFMARGEKTMGSEWAPSATDIAPTGIPEYETLLRFGGKWPISSWVVLGGTCAFIWQRNRDHVPGAWNDDLEMSAFASISIPPRRASKRDNSMIEKAPEVP